MNARVYGINVQWAFGDIRKPNGRKEPVRCGWRGIYRAIRRDYDIEGQEQILQEV